jgi:hypothetical protein
MRRENPRGVTVARPVRLLSCLAFLAAAAAGAWASAPGPLPAFDLTALDGSTTPAASLAREGRWLLVYVSPHSGASLPLLQALEGTEAPRPSLLIVVGSEPADAKAMAAGFEGRLDAAWYADPDGSARRALGLTGVPVVLGLRDGQIQWTLSGGVSDRRTLRSILVSWR